MMNGNYPTAIQAQGYQSYPTAPVPTVADVDPRETGNHIARLQVASELVIALLSRSQSIADRINSVEQEGAKGSARAQHMSLLQFPDDIIAAAKEAHIHLNRIEGALGV